MPKALAAVFISFLAIANADASSAGPAREIVIGVGGSREIPAPAGAAVNVGDGRIVKAVDLGSQLRLIGRRPGSAEVRVGAASYLAVVLPLEAAAAHERLASALGEMRGLRLETRGREIFVVGRLLRAEDWEALAHAAGASAAFRFAAEIDAAAASDALALVRARLAAAHLPEPSLRLAPEARASLGAGQAELLARYEAALKPFGFAVEANATTLSLEPLVRVNILVAELRRTHAGRLGISWPTTAQAQLLPAFAAPGSAPGGPITIDANAFEQSGAGRVLASPNILCRSGSEAEFFAGGEFPIKTKSFASQSVTWKKYGVLLKVKPRADAQGQMSIGLQTEVSDLDRSVVVEGVPAVVANRIESHFDLRRPRTIALSGLIKNETGDSKEGLFGLSRIPILGQLFGSRDWLERKTELVVFVTPETLPPEAEGT